MVGPCSLLVPWFCAQGLDAAASRDTGRNARLLDRKRQGHSRWGCRPREHVRRRRRDRTVAEADDQWRIYRFTGAPVFIGEEDFARKALTGG